MRIIWSAWIGDLEMYSARIPEHKTALILARLATGWVGYTYPDPEREGEDRVSIYTFRATREHIAVTVQQRFGEQAMQALEDRKA